MSSPKSPPDAALRYQGCGLRPAMVDPWERRPRREQTLTSAPCPMPVVTPHRPEGRPPTRHFGLGSRSHHAGAGPWEGRRVGVLPSARAGCKRGTRRVPVASLLRPEGRPPTSTSGLGAGYPCCIGLGASPWERLRSSISPNLSPTTGFSPAAYLIHSPAHPLTPSFHVYFTS